MPLSILLCDPQLIVAYKPSLIPTQPDFTELVRSWIKKKFHKPGNVFLHPIHRLDRVASGLVLFARTSKALSRLQEAMRTQSIEKIYMAWVEGSPQELRGTLHHHLLHGSFRAIVSPQGKLSSLHYEIVSREEKQALLRIQLLTGRYHQIRAQMAEIGCPILGDIKYGSHRPWPSGIALCATELKFLHPTRHTDVTLSLNINRDTLSPS